MFPNKCNTLIDFTVIDGMAKRKLSFSIFSLDSVDLLGSSGLCSSINHTRSVLMLNTFQVGTILEKKNLHMRLHLRLSACTLFDRNSLMNITLTMKTKQKALTTTVTNLNTSYFYVICKLCTFLWQ